MKPETKYEKGLTWRTILALVFASVVVQPGIMYIYLVSGWALPLSTWLVILLWVEISRLMGNPMRKQEIFLIMAFQWTALSGAWFFLNPVKSLFFAQSTIPEAVGLPSYVPSWWAPQIGTGEEIRSFFDPRWASPIAVLVATFFLGRIAEVSIGYLCYQIYAVEEKLEFPAQSASAQTIVTLAEREHERMRVLTMAATIGMIYAIFSFMLPYFTGGLAASPLKFLPRGWVDLTYLIERYIPGGAFGFDATLFTFISGFIVPLKVLTLMFATTLSIYLIGNHFAIPEKYGGFGLWPEWKPGMPLLLNVTRSQIYIWFSVAIGFMLAVAFIPLMLRPQVIIRAFGALRKAAGKGESPASLWLLLAAFFGSALSSVALFHILVPDIPIWLPIVFSVGFSLFSSFISASAAGVTFGGTSVPYLRECAIYYSGYKGLNAWYANYITWGTSPFLNLQMIGGLAWVASPPMAGLPLMVNGSVITGHLRMADIVNCSKREYIITVFLVMFLGFTMSFIYTSVFWNAAPIPSSAYPYTVTGWMTEVIERARWVNWLWTGILFNSTYIWISFIVGTLVSVICRFLGAFYAPIAIATGILTPMPVVISQFIGGIIGYFLRKRMGTDRWIKYRPLIVIGFIIGDGVISTITVATSLVSKAQWVLPY